MSKKGTKALASATLMSLVLTTALSAGPVKAAAGQVTRIGEADRYSTAAKVATTNWTTSDNVVLVSGEGYADAVSASALAKKLNAPILLTTAGSLNADAQAALSTLKAKNIYVVGGNASVSQDVRTALKANYSLVELQGANRYETNVAVAKQLVALGVDPTNVMMVGGEGFSDALSVAPIAAAKGQILLLGNNSADSMKSVIDFVNSNKSKVTVVGTSNVISDSILNAVGGTRIDGGASRFDTNLKVLAAFKDTVKADKLFVANASGNGYADALVASALAGKTASALVLVDADGTSATDNAIAYIKANATKTTDLNVVGGTGVVSDATVASINNAVNPVVVNPTVGDITSVEAVDSQTVNAKSSDEVLKFTINGGQSVTADDVVKAGYTIKFVTDQPVFEGTTIADAELNNSGELDKTNMKAVYAGTDIGVTNGAADHFKYQVQIYKDDVLVGQTAFTRVDLISGDETANTLGDVTLKQIIKDDYDTINAVTDRETVTNSTNSAYFTTKITSGKLVKGEESIVSKVKGSLVNGLSNVEITNVKFYSSDPYVASVDENTGVITANETGTFTLTVQSGTTKKDISLQVVETARKLSAVTSNVSSVKVGRGASSSVDLTFKDQYGDTMEAVGKFGTASGDVATSETTANDNEFKINPVKNSDDDLIAVTTTAATDKTADTDGKMTITIANNTTDTPHTGSGTLKVVNNSGSTMLSIAVAVNSSSLTNSTKLEAVKDGKSADLTLDLNAQAAGDNDNEYVKLNLNKYSSDGTSLGAVAGTVSGSDNNEITDTNSTNSYDFFISQSTSNKIVDATTDNLTLIPVPVNADGTIVVTTPYGVYDNGGSWSGDTNYISTIISKVTSSSPKNVVTVAKTGTITLVAKDHTSGQIKSSVNITVKDSSPTISSVKWESSIEQDSSTSALSSGIDLTSILKAANVTVSGSAGDGKVRIAENGAIYINMEDGVGSSYNNEHSTDIDDKTDDVHGFDSATDVLLGYIVAMPTNSDVQSAYIGTDGKLYIAMNGTKTSGKVTVGIRRPHDSSLFSTTTITLDTNN